MYRLYIHDNISPRAHEMFVFRSMGAQICNRVHGHNSTWSIFKYVGILFWTSVMVLSLDWYRDFRYVTLTVHTGIAFPWENGKPHTGVLAAPGAVHLGASLVCVRALTHRLMRVSIFQARACASGKGKAGSFSAEFTPTGSLWVFPLKTEIWICWGKSSQLLLSNPCRGMTAVLKEACDVCEVTSVAKLL